MEYYTTLHVTHEYYIFHLYIKSHVFDRFANARPREQFVHHEQGGNKVFLIFVSNNVIRSIFECTVRGLNETRITSNHLITYSLFVYTYFKINFRAFQYRFK